MNTIHNSAASQHKSRLKYSRSFGEVTAAQEARQQEQINCDQLETDRRWITVHLEQMHEIANRFQRLNGTRKDHAKDDPKRVVLDGVLSRTFQKDLALKVWKGLICQPLSSKTQVSGVATLGPGGEVKSLEFAQGRSGTIRTVATFSGDHFSFERGDLSHFIRVNGERNGEVDYEYGYDKGWGEEYSYQKSEGRLSL